MGWKNTLIGAVPFVLTAATHAQIVLTDVTAQAGVSFTHVPAALAIPGPQDWMPAGIAVADYDRDGWQDIYWASGGITPDRLFINNGDGTFHDAAMAWGLGTLHAACGAAAGDFDDDGWTDIYVTSFGMSSNNQGQVGKNKLYRNNGNGTFSEVATPTGVAFTALTLSSGYGCSFGDYDLDGDLDLCATAWYAPAQGNRLFRNNGDGTFTNVTGTAITFPTTTWGFQGRFADMDGDGWPELLISADFGTSRYYKNNRDGTFTDLTVASGTGLDQNGMGQTVGDVDNDGDLDWYVTSIFLDVQQPASGEGNKLYINQGNHQYVEVSNEYGVANGGWGWGTAAVDLDQDGQLDLVEVNGRPGNVEFTGEQEYVFRNLGNGSFAEVTIPCGLTFKAEGKSLATIDYDRDGDMDLLITFNGNLTKLYRNDSPGGRSLHVALTTDANPLLAPHGSGARVTAKVGRSTYMRYMDGGPAFLNTSEWAVHFGLGSAPMIDELRIQWPRGYETVMHNVVTNQHLTIEAPALGDLDGNGSIGSSDLAILLGVWGPITESANLKADQNGDGVVGSADLALLLGQWNS